MKISIRWTFGSILSLVPENYLEHVNGSFKEVGACLRRGMAVASVKAGVAAAAAVSRRRARALLTTTPYILSWAPRCRG